MGKAINANEISSDQKYKPAMLKKYRYLLLTGAYCKTKINSKIKNEGLEKL